MMEQGLLDEVKALLEKGYSPELPALQGLGYKQLLSFLSGTITLSEAVEAIKRETRRFAKRQITWFKREKDVTWMNYPDYNNSQTEMLDAMLKMIKERGIIKR